jgi:hypothetical protein
MKLVIRSGERKGAGSNLPRREGHFWNPGENSGPGGKRQRHRRKPRSGWSFAQHDPKLDSSFVPRRSFEIREPNCTPSRIDPLRSKPALDDFVA